jgi:hypothetical protein
VLKIPAQEIVGMTVFSFVISARQRLPWQVLQIPAQETAGMTIFHL